MMNNPDGPMMNLPLGAQMVEEYTGHEGIPSRIGVLLANAVTLKAVEDAGCGAWAGRSVCGAKPVIIVLGQTQLLFGMYRAIVYSPYEVIGFVCSRHEPPNTMMDMPRSLRRSQEKERQKLLATL